MVSSKTTLATIVNHHFNHFFSEPARFEIANRNISTKRGEQAILLCDALGDYPIQITWTFNNNRLDINNFRFRTADQKTNTGLKSRLTISRTDRQDSGIFRCHATNIFGRADMTIGLSVQGMVSSR